MSKKEYELELWKSWNENKSNDSLNELLESFNPLIEKEVNVFKTSPLPKDALKLRALSLTKKALDTYDPNKSQLNLSLIHI